MWDEVRFYTDSIVADQNLSFFRAQFHSHFDAGLRWRVLRGVIDQIAQNLSDARTVDFRDDWFFRHIDRNGVRLVCKQLFVAIYRVLHAGPKIDGFYLQYNPPSRDPCDV